MRFFTTTAVAALLLFGATGCGDLLVDNTNNPDRTKALANPGDVESLVAGAWYTWHLSTIHYYGPGPLLSSMSFQHTTRVANFGQLYYPAIPRNPTANSSADSDYSYWSDVYTWNYRAISAVNNALAAFDNGLEILDDPGTAADSQDRNRHDRAEAFARFIQGISYAYVALMFDQGALVDETTDLEAGVEFVGYNELMDAALGFLDTAIALSNASDFEIPYTWMAAADQPFTSDRLAQLASSYKAKFRAAIARTPAERAAVDWNAVVADINAGLTEDFSWLMDNNNWWHGALYYTLLQSGPWSSMPYFIHGMADQSGQYQAYMALPHGEKHPDHAAVGPMVLQTPDLRFPQGATLEEQRDNSGTRFFAPTNYEAGWASATRGTWRWSYYRDNRHHVNTALFGTIPDVSMVEQNMLLAEAYLQGASAGDAGDAADLINVTRTAAGLNATDASGANTSCVPRLYDNTCGDLFEMMKWEKRMLAGHNASLMMVPWYFDGRGWGDHMEGTILNWPVPALVAELEGLPIVNYGGNGTGLDWAAPVGNYGY